MEFSRQDYCSGYLFPSPGDLSDPGIEPGSPTLQADSLPSEPPGNPAKDDTQMESKHTTTCSEPLVVRETQIKTAMTYHFVLQG